MIKVAPRAPRQPHSEGAGSATLTEAESEADWVAEHEAAEVAEAAWWARYWKEKEVMEVVRAEEEEAALEAEEKAAWRREQARRDQAEAERKELEMRRVSNTSRNPGHGTARDELMGAVCS